MRTLLVTALVSIFSASADAADLSFYENMPVGELRLLKVLPGDTSVSVYITGEPENNDSFKRGETHLNIHDSSNSWWVSPSGPGTEIDALGFVEGSYLIVGLRSAGGASTLVLDTKSRESYSLGQGIGEVLRDGPNAGLIRLSGSYGYDDEGRYWYTSIVDLNGRVIEFGSEGDTCLPVSHIVRHGRDISQLRQSLDFCAGVSR
jgi:hypothetical protein